MKRTVSLILAALLTLSVFAACGGEPETKKTTTGFDSFEITYYWGPQDELATEKVFWERAKEAGFTSVPVEGVKAEYNKVALGYLKELGLTCSALSDSRISRLLSRSYSDDEMDAIIREVIADYAEYADIIKGWWLKDEPTDEPIFKKLNRVIEAIKRVDPERTAYVNLNPYTKRDSYVWAVDLIKPQYVSYDHYVFLNGRRYRASYFTIAEAVRSVALERGLDYMVINLLTKHFDYADLTRAQLLWQNNMALCYGMKRLSYFTYTLNNGLVAEGWTDACVDPTGEKYPHFDVIKELNALALPLGRELFKKDSTAVFHIETEKDTLENYCTAYESFGKLGKVSGDDFVVGFFSDDSFMIVNKVWRETEERYNNVVFDEITSGLQYFDIYTSSWKNYDTKNAEGKYVYNAEPGEGLLFRVK